MIWCKRISKETLEMVSHPLRMEEDYAIVGKGKNGK